MGTRHVEQALEQSSDFSRQIQELVTEYLRVSANQKSSCTTFRDADWSNSVDIGLPDSRMPRPQTVPA